MFITNAVLTQAIADRLKLANGISDLQNWSASIIVNALTASYQEILGRLMRRGFTQAQADSFDRGAEFQTDLGVYYFWTRTGIYGGNDPKAVEALDRRKELNSVFVFNLGVWVNPPQTDAGQVITGLQEDGLVQWPTACNIGLPPGTGGQWGGWWQGELP